MVASILLVVVVAAAAVSTIVAVAHSQKRLKGIVVGLVQHRNSQWFACLEKESDLIETF